MDSRSPRVLVVDDSPAMRAYVTATLEDRGFDVLGLSTAFDALKVLPRERFDLIISDINMPDIHGLELIRYIRSVPAHAAVPLIVISTDGSERDRDRALKLGATSYLIKPFSSESLVEAVERLLPAA